MAMTWTCACGKQHLIVPGKEIKCISVGHAVIIKPEYFKYRTKTEQPKTIKDQYALF
jgi:hypothetical protein